LFWIAVVADAGNALIWSRACGRPDLPADGWNDMPKRDEAIYGPVCLDSPRPVEANPSGAIKQIIRWMCFRRRWPPKSNFLKTLSAGRQQRTKTKRKERKDYYVNKAKTLKGYKLDSLDGEIGKVKEFYFDDRHWTIRYLVADTGNWLPGRQVLISPYALVAVNTEEEQHIARRFNQKADRGQSILGQ
jgi:hypothetical protein